MWISRTPKWYVQNLLKIWCATVALINLISLDDDYEQTKLAYALEPQLLASIEQPYKQVDETEDLHWIPWSSSDSKRFRTLREKSLGHVIINCFISGVNSQDTSSLLLYLPFSNLEFSKGKLKNNLCHLELETSICHEYISLFRCQTNSSQIFLFKNEESHAHA